MTEHRRVVGIESETAVDPVAYEIIRHRLLMLNEESASTVVTTSGSPVVVFGRDFNSAVLTGSGEYVFFGRNIKIHAGAIDLVIADILASEENDGLTVRAGDMFLSNDPWVGSGHQNDVAVVCPIFDGPDLLFWVGNALHHMDIGGAVVGGRSSRSRSSFEEPTIFPPVRIVEDDVLRPDLARLFVRQSRLPSYEALDLRAQVAGNLTAKQRLLEMINEFGAATMRAVAESILFEGSRRFERALDAVPDGEWHEEAFLDGVRDRDRAICRVALRLVKDGRHLEFADDGSDPQLPAPVNSAFGAWRAGIICAVMSQFGAEVALGPGGALRHIRFSPQPGTVLNARHPAPVNRATGLGVGLAAGMAMKLLSRALCPEPAFRPTLAAISGSEPLIVGGLTGQGADGSRYLRVFTDPVACGSGAFGGGDGDATGGSSINLGAVIANVEEYEAVGGYLYLYRREEPDTGGAGRRRGGNAIGYAVVPYQVQTSVANITGWGLAFPTFSGDFGGYPAAARRVLKIGASDVWATVEGGGWPGSDEEIAGAREVLPGRAEEVPLHPADVMVLVSGGGAGIGDPLERPPAQVARDVADGAISQAAARLLYGAVLGADHAVDDEATAARRLRLRAERAERPIEEVELALSRPPVPPEGRASPRPGVVLDGDALVCASCGSALGGAQLAFTTTRRVPLESRLLADSAAADFVDAAASLVERACSGCGSLLSADVEVIRLGADTGAGPNDGPSG